MADSPERREALAWCDLVVQIRTGDPDSIEHLYRAVSSLSRSRIRRRVDHQLVEDKLHDVVISVLEAIYSNELRDPSRLDGFIRTVARRRIAHYIRTRIDSRRRLVKMELTECPARPVDSPEAPALNQDRAKLVNHFLRKLVPRDREIMVRFYLLEESPQEICKAMSLSATQFRLFKSRALARCVEYARKSELQKLPITMRRVA